MQHSLILKISFPFSLLCQLSKLNMYTAACLKAATGSINSNRDRPHRGHSNLEVRFTPPPDFPVPGHGSPNVSLFEPTLFILIKKTHVQCWQ